MHPIMTGHTIMLAQRRMIALVATATFMDMLVLYVITVLQLIAIQHNAYVIMHFTITHHKLVVQHVKITPQC